MPDQNIAWKRLALEVVVIVGSILLAFWIEAWWDGQQELEERNALVGLLREDISETIESFRRLNGASARHLAALDKLRDVVHAQTPRPPADSLVVLLSSLRSIQVFHPEVAAFQAEADGPAWSRLPSEVKVEVAAFANAGASFEDGVHQQTFIRLLEVLARYGSSDAVYGTVPAESPFAPDHDGLLADPGFVTWLSWMWIFKDNNQTRRTEWIGRLAAVDSRLAELVGETPRRRTRNRNGT